MRILSKNEEELLELLAHELFSCPIKKLQDFYNPSLKQEALAQAVYLLVFSDTAIFQKQVQISDRLQLQAAIASNLRVNYNHIYTNEIMKYNNIPYVILKGCASARYYPNPIYRSMGDVDFLVPKYSFEQAKRVLEAEEFVGSEENHICHIAYHRDNDHLELHHTPAGMPEGMVGELAKQYFADVFETAVEVELDGGVVAVPDDFHHGLILLLHTCHHMTGEGVGLRHICDWAVFANSLENDKFEAIFKKS